METGKPEKPVERESVPMAAVDARSIVPVGDEIGGIVVYVGGRPAYYVLNGEWFSAVCAPQACVAGNALSGEAGAEGGPSRATGIVSTS